MRKWLLLILLTGLLIFPSMVGAQGGTTLKSMNIELWSEFDQPSMLVIHEFTVDPGTPLPVQVTLRFPKDGNLIAVAYAAPNLVNAEFTGPEEQGDWQTVTLNVKTYDPHRIEYYQPLTREENRREFVFRWFGDYPVDAFNVTVQIPADSTNVTTTPAFASSTASADGLHLIGLVNSGSLRMGQSYEFKINYDRESNLVTVPSNSANVQPSEPVDSNTEGRVSVDNLPWIIGGFGLALIGMALFFYWRSSQAGERRSRRRRHTGQTTEDSEDAQAYCHECGTRAQASDRFCRTCGSKLRV